MGCFCDRLDAKNAIVACVDDVQVALVPLHAVRVLELDPRIALAATKNCRDVSCTGIVLAYGAVLIVSDVQVPRRIAFNVFGGGELRFKPRAILETTLSSTGHRMNRAVSFHHA